MLPLRPKKIDQGTQSCVSSQESCVAHKCIIYRSRHMVVCQWPRKPCGTQVCYLQEMLSHRFQPLISLYNDWANFYQIHILLPFIYAILLTKFNEICCVLYETSVPENCPIFFTFFSSSHSFTKVTLSQPKTPFS